MSKKSMSAYHIIDAPTVFDNSPSAAYEGVPNGWNGDSRFLSISDFSNPKRFIRMENHGEKDRFSSINRPFCVEYEGILTIELMIDVCSLDNGVYIAVLTPDEKRVLTLGVKEGKWWLLGKTESFSNVKVSEKEEKLYSLVINLDLDSLCAYGSINNISLGKIRLEKCGVDKLEIGINKGGVGIVELKYARMWKNYAANCHFAVTPESIGEVPIDWKVTGNFGMYSMASCKGLETYSMKSETKKGEISTARHSFLPQSGLFCLEVCVLFPKKINGARIIYDNDGSRVSGVVSGENECFTAVLYNIPNTMYDDIIVARPYILINGVYFYGGVREASLKSVATEMNNNYNSLTEDEKNIVDLILGNN